MKFSRSDTGAALLEFSLIVPIVALMFMAVVDLGIAIAQGMTVEDAARAGAEYGTIAGNQSNISGMQNAAINAANGMAGFTATATTWCTCTAGGSAVACTTSIAACGAYGIQIEYVQVQTSATVQVLAGYPGLPSSFALTGLAVLRVQ